MAVLNALRRTPGALRRNPVLFVPVLLALLFQIPQFALQAVDPVLGSVVSVVFSLVFVVFMPFFQGGVIGMADESLDGYTSMGTFLDDGKANYVSLLVAYLALMAVNFVLGMVGFAVAVFGGVVVLESGGLASANLAALAVLGAVVALVFLLYLLVVFFVQFYGQAIVLEGRGAVSGLKRSVSVVRHNLVSTLGYSVLGVVVGGLAGVVFGAASILLSPRSTALFDLPAPSIPTVLGVGVVLVVGGAVFGAFFGVFSVAFYRELVR